MSDKKIIVATDLTASAADNRHLVPLLDQVTATMGTPPHTAVAENNLVAPLPLGMRTKQDGRVLPALGDRRLQLGHQLAELAIEAADQPVAGGQPGRRDVFPQRNPRPDPGLLPAGRTSAPPAA